MYIMHLNCKLDYRSEYVYLYAHKNLSFSIIRLYLISGQGHACLTEHGHVSAAPWCQMEQTLSPADQGGTDTNPRRGVLSESHADEALPDAGSAVT